MIRYIEFFGPPLVGKSYLSDNFIKILARNYSVLKPRQLIIRYLISTNKKKKFFFYLIILLLINNNFYLKVKKKFFTKRVIRINKGKINFERKNISFKGRLNFKSFYNSRLKFISKKFISNKDLKIIKDKIYSLNTNQFNKNIYYYWTIENILAFEIAFDKNNNHVCVADEGILQRFFMLTNLTKDKKLISKISLIKKLNDKVIYLNPGVNNILNRLKERTKINNGFIYSNKKQVFDIRKKFKDFIEYSSVLINIKQISKSNEHLVIKNLQKWLNI